MNWAFGHKAFLTFFFFVLLIELVNTLLYIGPHEQKVVDEL